MYLDSYSIPADHLAVFILKSFACPSGGYNKFIYRKVFLDLFRPLLYSFKHLLSAHGMPGLILAAASVSPGQYGAHGWTGGSSCDYFHSSWGISDTALGIKHL